MREYGSNIILPSLDNLFSSEQERQDAKLEKIQILPLSELHPFEGHPFQVHDDEEMDKMVDSVKEYGVMTPAIVRPRRDGGYEIVAGHRRCHASQRAGVDTMPCIVRELDDDTAIILMVDSNCQREHILPSEKAKAYQMKLEAIKRKGGRPSKINSGQVGPNYFERRSNQIVADEAGESVKQVQRFIRLNKLTPDLMQLVDDGRLKTTPAVELSYLTPEEQEEFLSYMEEEGCTPSLSQAQKLKAASKESVLTKDTIHEIMSARSPSVKPREPQLTIAVSKVERYFPNNDHPKWDFSGEGQAVAKTYEVNAAEIAAYNKTLTAAGDNKNGKGDGWQPTGTANEYRLAEIFSNDTGNIRVQGLPYGTYLVVETTVPKDLYQAEPYLVVIDRNSPMSAMATPKGSVLTASDSYQKFTVLNEQIEVYLRITKLDEETGKPVLLPGTAFQIYYLDDDGNYRMENGAPKLVRMTDTVNGHLTKNVTTFYTNEEGVLTLPEKLPLGKYRIVETTAPNGYYNAWAADASHYVDFTITTDRIYQATGDKNENGMDTLVIGEKYTNHETLGKLTIRKTGEVLTGWQSEPGGIDPWMTGEAESGDFVYETRPLAGAEYTITAAEDIYTQDRQLDNYGNRTLWYAKGDVVAVVTTGDGTADTAVFAPARTAATYDFLSVIHDGTIGEVSVTLPLGSYHIAETKPPYGYVGTDDSFDVTLAWDNQTHEIVVADTVEFHNEREKAKVGIYKTDLESGKYLAGAVFNLYAADDIYDADGSLVFAAGELVATSPETNADGYTYFTCDIPIRGEQYGSSTHKDATTNSGNYIVKELRAPLGYYVNEEPMEVTFTYDGQAIMVLDNTCANKPTEMWVSKRDLTNDEELPGATLAIKDTDGNTVTTWVSTDEPHRVTGLHFGESYTLTEIRAADGYALANDITFRLIQKSDEDGNHLEECEVYYLTTKNILFWKWDDWKLLDDATVIMQDDITKVQISKKDLTTNEELPGAELTLTDEKGNEIDRWISTDAPHYMEKLPAGKYTLTEVTAPDGYAIAERMEFEVLPNGEVQTFEMFDDTIKVKISKVDITTNEELPGAELVIKDKDGTEIDRWISTNGPHYVEKMPAGDYTLTEITAPNGYKVAESIDFTVLPTGEMQTVVMKDAREDTPTPTPDNTPTPDHTPQPTPNTTPAPTPVPAAPTATPTPLLTIPKTGDNSSLGLQLAIAGISLAGLAVLVHKSARRKDIAPRDDDDEDTED